MTASDVASRAGVSKWTVCRAFTPGSSISDRALERVKKAAEALGYRPNLLARSLSTKHTHLIGVVVDDNENPNALRLLDVVTRQLQASGYLAILINLTSEQSRGAFLSQADQFQVDGLFFLGTTLTDQLLKLARVVRNIPVVVLGRSSDNPDIHVVSTDGFTGGREIARLLAEQRPRRIGYMSGPSSIDPNSESTQVKRLDGFRAGLAELGLELSCVLPAGTYRRSAGFHALEQYLQATPAEERIEALFCENDVLAVGAIDALRAHGAEGRIAIVGFDDIELAASPSYDLTTYRQPVEALAKEAIRRLSAPNEPTARFIAPGQLVRRTSHLRRR